MLHDKNACGHLLHNRKVMCDKKPCKPILRMQFVDKIQKSCLCNNIQCAGRFIKEQQTGTNKECSDHHCTLKLPPAELMRQTLCRIGRQVCALEHHMQGTARLPVGDKTETAQRLKQKLPDRHTRAECLERILKDQLEMSVDIARPSSLRRCQRLSQKGNTSVRRRFKSRNHLQER